jgi:hypothetical protein
MFVLCRDIASGDVEISEKERYTIATKLTQFYVKKYDRSDFEPHNADQLVVCNYNKTNPSLIMVKKEKHTDPYNGECNPQIISWNLGILLSKLLIEPTYESEYTDSTIDLVDKAIDKLIHEEHPTAKSVTEIKRLLEEILKSLD